MVRRNQIIARVQQTIDQHCMICKGDQVLVGLSGGGDSMALLDVLLRLAPGLGFSVGAAHLNHGLREEAAVEARQVAQWVTGSGLFPTSIPFYTAEKAVAVHRRQYRQSLEEAARDIRYRYLESVAREHGYNKIALGHQQGDNAELVLMFLLRGAGPEGLRGIPPVRGGQSGMAAIIRPLLDVGRKEIEAYLKRRHIPFIIDASNHDPTITRNRIRHELIPQLEADYNPRIIESLNRLAAVLNEERKWLQPEIESRLDRLVSTLPGGGVQLAVFALVKLPSGLVRRILRSALLRVKGNLRRLEYGHLMALEGLLADHPRPAAVDLPGGIRCRRVADTLEIVHDYGRVELQEGDKPRKIGRDQPGAGYDYLIPAPSREQARRIIIPECGCQFRFSLASGGVSLQGYRAGQLAAFFDMDKLRFPLRIRNVRPGDAFHPLGRNRPLKVAKLMSDLKVSRAFRKVLPILLSGEEIIWVTGCRTGETGKVDRFTQNCLVVQKLLVS